MGCHCNTGLESDDVLDCPSSFSSENLNTKVETKEINSDGLCAEWEEIFLRLDQQDGVHDGRIHRFGSESNFE